MCKPNSPHRGICPEGWHVPTQSEFDILYKMIGGKSTAGTKLKSISGWDEEKNGIDAFGFGLLPEIEAPRDLGVRQKNRVVWVIGMDRVVQIDEGEGSTPTIRVKQLEGSRHAVGALVLTRRSETTEIIV